MTNGQGIDRVFQIIDSISYSKDGLSLNDITTNTGLNKSTVFRTLNELKERSLVFKDNNGRYHIGYKFAQIASLYLTNIDLKNVASPLLYGLSLDLKVAVHLAILSNDKCLYIDQVNPLSAGFNYSKIGKTNELYCSALGKVLLSYFSLDERKEYFNRHNFNKITKNTKDKDEVLKDLDFCIKNGYCMDICEREDNIYCLACPIFDYKGECIAALSITSTEQSLVFNDDSIRKIKDTANRISRMFGYRG